MAGCDTGFIDIGDSWNQATALRKYSSHISRILSLFSKFKTLKTSMTRRLIAEWKKTLT